MASNRADEKFFNEKEILLSSFNTCQLNLQFQDHEYKKWSTKSDSQLSLSSEPNKMCSPTSTDVLKSLDLNSVEKEVKEYKDLFSKLKVIFLEQSTKENFIREILDEEQIENDDDDDLWSNTMDLQNLKFWSITQTQIEKLSIEIAELKSGLVNKKAELDRVSDQLTATINHTCQEYSRVKLQVDQAEKLLSASKSMYQDLLDLESNVELQAQDTLAESHQLSVELAEQLATIRADIFTLTHETIPEYRSQASLLAQNLLDLRSLATTLTKSASAAVRVRRAERQERALREREDIAAQYSKSLEILAKALQIQNIKVDSDHVVLTTVDKNHQLVEIIMKFNHGKLYDGSVCSFY
ncbi:uncharacterized protein V1516DRAFT_308611 [Lipomyces oligophaga]|uniref:uncharacterized protein n=1 Tax=Lipomyces oligophaga TaxID=45792 RepID=UPI0034CEBBC8